MGGKLAVCIPTCDRAAVLQETLEFVADYYPEYNMDLYICDSSQNEETRRIVAVNEKKFYGRLYYKTYPSALCLDYKIIEILKEFQQEDYDYVWMINDSVSITREAMDVVMPLLEEEYDLLRLPLAGAGKRDDRIITNANDWFHECSQGMAHMPSTIFSAALWREADVDWEGMGRKYVGTNELTDGHGYFFLVAFYLEQILKLDKFQGIFIGNRVKWRRDSPLKEEKSYWSGRLFDVWAGSYPETILKLPEAYTDKEKVVYLSDNIIPGRFSAQMLIRYRIDGKYNRHVYKKYRKTFRLVSKERPVVCKAIACTPVWMLRLWKKKSALHENEWQERLNLIELKLGPEEPIIVFGAGLYGERVIKKLVKDGFGSRIVGVAVTDKRENVSRIEGFSIYNVEELEGYKKDGIVLIATLPAAAQEIAAMLRRKKFTKMIKLFG